MIVESEVTDAPMAQIVVDNAKAAFAQVLELFHPPVVVPREVHSTAIIGENVTIGKMFLLVPIVLLMIMQSLKIM